MFVISSVGTVPVPAPPVLDWLIIQRVSDFNWEIAGALSRHFKISEFCSNEGKSICLTESSTTRWKEKARIHSFPEERIVLFSTQDFCDDFCSARFYPYFLAGSCEPSEFKFFHGFYSYGEQPTQSFRRKTFLILKRTENTAHVTYNCSTRVDWLID